MSANVYYHPEDLGLEIITQLNDKDAYYSFDDLVVLKHIESGNLFYCSDSGCSCPEPFENYYFNGLGDHNITPLTQRNFYQLADIVRDWNASTEDKYRFLGIVSYELKGKEDDAAPGL